MARPRKNKLPEVTIPEVEVLAEQISKAVEPPTEIINVPAAAEPTVTTTTTSTPVPTFEEAPKVIQPEMDRIEMDRYFRVINNSEQASRIMDAISHQRDLEMWGIHQYDNNRSRNSYSRSFYFKSRENAVIALEHAKKLTT